MKLGIPAETLAGETRVADGVKIVSSTANIHGQSELVVKVRSTSSPMRRKMRGESCLRS